MSIQPVLLRTLVVLSFTAALVPAGARAAAPAFDALGNFFPVGVSDDGNVVAGTGDGFVRWTAAGGLETIGNLPDAEYTFADAMSGDGNTIVGNDYNTNVVRWTRATGLQRLVPGNPSGVSYDGSVIVGDSGAGNGAFRWTQATGPVDIGAVLPGGYRFRFVRGVSNDGNAVAGTAEAGPAGNGGFHMVRWTPAGPIDLGDLPGGDDFAQASGISADGWTVVGHGHSAAGWEAVRWTRETGLQALGHLPGPGPNPTFLGHVGAAATSGDGSVIVGADYPGPTIEGVAFIWDESRGMRALKDVLQSDYDLDLTGWRLTGATDISPDGMTIVGTGYHTQFGSDVVAWRAALPEPTGAGTMLAIWGLCSLRRTRREQI